MTKPILTSDMLDREYDRWGAGNRNANDLRFGQFICCKYSMISDESFNVENKSEAYEMLRAELEKYQR